MTSTIVVKVNLTLRKPLLQETAATETSTPMVSAVTEGSSVSIKARIRGNLILPQAGLLKFNKIYCVRDDGTLPDMSAKTSDCIYGTDDIYVENTNEVAKILEELSLKNSNLTINGIITIEKIDNTSSELRIEPLASYTIRDHGGLQTIISALERMHINVDAKEQAAASKSRLDLSVV